MRICYKKRRHVGGCTKSLLKKAKMGTSQNPSWIIFVLFWPTIEKKLTVPTNEKKNFGHKLPPYKSPAKNTPPKVAYTKKKLTLENQPQNLWRAPHTACECFRRAVAIVSKWSQEASTFVAHKNLQYVCTYGTQILINVNFFISDIQKIADVI